jgi:C_GCAxxG_C_C family probable redox protein
MVGDIAGLDRIDGKALAALARKNFEAKLNCAESTSKAIADYWGIGQSAFPRAATPFGGGIARTGGMCGAVSGTLMGLGLIFGRNEGGDHHKLDRMYVIVRYFQAEFAKRFGSVICSELLKCNIGTDKGRIQAKKDKLFDKQCPDYVTGAMDIVAKIVEKAVRGDFDEKGIVNKE